MTTLTDQLGTALEGARLYEDSQRRAAREQVIGEVASSVRQELYVEDVLRAAVDQVQQALGLDKIVIQMASPEKLASPESAKQ